MGIQVIVEIQFPVIRGIPAVLFQDTAVIQAIQQVDTVDTADRMVISEWMVLRVIPAIVVQGYQDTQAIVEAAYPVIVVIPGIAATRPQAIQDIVDTAVVV